VSATTPKELLKTVLHAALGDYHYWKVFYIDLPQPPVELPDGVTIRPVSAEELEDMPDEGMRDRAVFGGEGAQGFGLFVGGELAAVQWYWWGERYQAERKGRSWVLPPDAAKSLGLYTRPEYRGRGYAALLKRHTAHLMTQQGFKRLYSRIWHSHKDSIRVSRKIGWHVAGSYIEVCPFSKRIKIRLPL